MEDGTKKLNSATIIYNNTKMLITVTMMPNINKLMDV
jgi:hypothetical protein